MMDGKLHWNSRDLTGETFGFLTIVRLFGSIDKRYHWVARCVCGKEIVVLGKDLTRKRGPSPTSCGCMTKELKAMLMGTHRMSKHPAYAVWRSMLARCLRPNHYAYHNYGGRGITICESWQKDFSNFWDDMGATYKPGLTLDRIDNNLGYNPNNCRWVTREVQANNIRRNRLISTPHGIMTAAQAAKRFKIKISTLYYRLDHGWPEEELFIPADFTNKVSCMTSKTPDRTIGSQSCAQTGVL